VTKLAAILGQINSGSVLLPGSSVAMWNRDQVRGLMSSLYSGYLVSGLLTPGTQADGWPVHSEVMATPPRVGQ
jgi:hypothetical protein